MIFNSKPRITQYFAANPDFYAQFGLFGHEGLDLVPEGGDWTIYSWTFGIVRNRYESSVYGLTVIIHDEHASISWRLAHLEKCFIDIGDRLDFGEKIGVMGDSPAGRDGIDGPMGAHLHINCVPMTVWGAKDYPHNGFKGRVDPLGALRYGGEL